MLSMKMILALFALAFMQVFALAGIETDIPLTNRVVLKSGNWTPVPEEMQKALLSVQSFLDQPSKTDDYSKADMKMILEHILFR
jgi:hypothetical protein